MGAKSSVPRSSHSRESKSNTEDPPTNGSYKVGETTVKVHRQQDNEQLDTVGELLAGSSTKNAFSAAQTSITSISSRGSRESRASKRMSFYEIVDANDVSSYLIVGNQASANDEEFLCRKKVMFVMNLSNLPLGYIHPDIQYKNVLLEDEDDSDLLNVLDLCLDTLMNWKQKCIKTKSRILIYSFNGVSRSCSVALAHLMNEERLTLRQAWEHLKEKHPSAKPNDGFVLQLMQFEQQNLCRNLSMTVADFYSKK